MFNFCNRQYFSSTLFNQYQQLYIIPAIEFWEQHKQQVWQNKRGTDIVLGGDGNTTVKRLRMRELSGEEVKEHQLMMMMIVHRHRWSLIAVIHCWRT